MANPGPLVANHPLIQNKLYGSLGISVQINILQQGDITYSMWSNHCVQELLHVGGTYSVQERAKNMGSGIQSFEHHSSTEWPWANVCFFSHSAIDCGCAECVE